jgi:hypothetical protein
MTDTVRTQASHDVDAGVDYLPTELDHRSSGLRDELQQVMSRVRPDDLSTNEVAALLDVLRPANCRVVGGPANRPALRLLGIGSEHPTP